MNGPRVVVYKHPNPQIRSFFTSDEISAYRVEYFKNPLREDSEEVLNELGVVGKLVVREIMAIPGVEDIYIKPREVRIKKGPSISWDKIEEKALEILNRALRRKEMRLVKKNRART